MKKLYLFALILTITCVSGYSQTKLNPWSIGVHAGTQQYNGELGNQFFKFTDHYNGLAGLSFGRYLTDHFDLGVDITLGDIKFSEKNLENKLVRYEYNMYQANFNVKYNILGKDDVQFRPFVFAGVGIIQFEGHSRKETNLALPAAGLGVNYMLNPNVKIRYQNTLLLSNYDELDNRKSGGNDSYLQTTIGLYATIVGTQDADNDGVSDKNDKCPGTAPGTKVDKEGCPVDRDADGVVNENDKCPDVAGKVELGGCPDADGDGVADHEDACPNKAGTAELGGCPDTDGDGIADNLDKCPEEAGVSEREGCPEPVDVKNMGMYTYNKLPYKNGKLIIFDENGVAVDTVLTDENGIFNYSHLNPDKNYTILPIEFKGDDKAIDIYLVDNEGNKTYGTTKRDDGKFEFKPTALANNEEVKKDDVKKGDTPKVDTKVETKKPESSDIPKELLTDIQYSLSSSSINIKYYKQLDQLAVAMKKAHNAKLIIHGYADNTGPLSFNIRLTQTRADRIKSYLIRKGITSDRITAEGKGIDNPKASNTTEEGRATNRRSELFIK